MKLIFTLTLLIANLFLHASGMPDSLPPTDLQKALASRISCVVVKESPPAATIKLRCGTRTFDSTTQPILVVDGVVRELGGLGSINPNDIVSVDILKDASSNIISCGPRRGVIVVTTRFASLRKFIIRDFLSNEKIPFASVSFHSATDSVNIIADENGKVETDRLKPSVQYRVTVSSSGYKSISLSALGKTGGQMDILLQRDMKECESVIISSTVCLKRVSCFYAICSTGCPRKKSKAIIDSSNSSFTQPILDNNISLYPNPVQRGQIFHLNYEARIGEALQLTITAMNGKTMLTESRKADKGLNRFSFSTSAEWAAGIYIVQLRNEAGKNIKTDKLSIQ
jgi:hypothetical protein